MTATEPLASQRALFDLPVDVTYLNCAYLSPQLRSVTAAGHAAVDAKAHPWHTGPGDFFATLEQVRTTFADLIGGDAEGVAVVPSASYGIGTAAANLPLEEGERVVVLAEQFPSNVYPWRALAGRVGAEVTTVAWPADGDWTAGVCACIDERTAIVAVPNCHWTDGSLVDLVRVGEAARAAGAALVVDASQSLGALPFDIQAVRPDFLVGVGYKWLLGPYSLGFVWAAPERRDGVPLEQTWMGRAGSDDFARLVDYADAYQPGARRYDMGEAANFVLLPMALEALRQIGQWGVERIAVTLRGLTDAIVADAVTLGLSAPAGHRRAGHIVGLGLPAGAASDVASALAERDVHVSVRGRSIRVSPHLYNDAGDIARLRWALAAVV